MNYFALALLLGSIGLLLVVLALALLDWWNEPPDMG